MAISISGAFGTDTTLTIDETHVLEVVSTDNQDDDKKVQCGALDRLVSCEVQAGEGRTIPGRLSSLGFFIGGLLGSAAASHIASIWGAIFGYVVGAAAGAWLLRRKARKDDLAVVNLKFDDALQAKIAVNEAELRLLHSAATRAVPLPELTSPSIQLVALTSDQKEKARLTYWVGPALAALAVGMLGVYAWYAGYIGPTSFTWPSKEQGGITFVWITDNLLLLACVVCVLLAGWKAITGEKRRRRLRQADKTA